MQNGHVGPLKAPVAGRTDHLPLSVDAGAYVFPADVVSGLGEGNTEAGYRILDSLFPSNRSLSKRNKVPVVVAGGEYVVHPDQIEQKFGSLKEGHAILDKYVVAQRKKLIKTLSKLPGPVK